MSLMMLVTPMVYRHFARDGELVGSVDRKNCVIGFYVILYDDHAVNSVPPADQGNLLLEKSIVQ